MQLHRRLPEAKALVAGASGLIGNCIRMQRWRPRESCRAAAALVGDTMLEMCPHAVVCFLVRANATVALAAAHQIFRSDRQRFVDADFLPDIPAPHIASNRQDHLPRHLICRYRCAYTLYHSYPCRSPVPRSSAAAQLRGRVGQDPAPPPPLIARNWCTDGASPPPQRHAGDGGDVRDGGWTGSAAAL